MPLASVHLPPAFTVPVAVILGVWIVWYWFRLGREGVPASRRQIRRVSLAVMFLATLPFVRALSFVDPALSDASRKEYITTWTVCGFMLLLLVLTATLDVFNNMRLHRNEQQEVMLGAVRTLIDAAKNKDQPS